MESSPRENKCRPPARIRRRKAARQGNKTVAPGTKYSLPVERRTTSNWGFIGVRVNITRLKLPENVYENAKIFKDVDITYKRVEIASRHSALEICKNKGKKRRALFAAPGHGGHLRLPARTRPIEDKATFGRWATPSPRRGRGGRYGYKHLRRPGARGAAHTQQR